MVSTSLLTDNQQLITLIIKNQRQFKIKIMKTIDEIVARSDYKNLNYALNERVKEIAEIIRKKMYELQINDLGEYSIIEVKSNSGFSDEYLSVEDEYAYRSLEDDESRCFAGDYNCHICAATYQQKLHFLNSSKSLFEMLDKIETKKCEEIEKALQENK